MMSSEYIIGLVDGEGSFTVQVRNENNASRQRRAKAEPRFYIKLIEKDKEVLYQVKEFFGCGNVYFQKDTRPNHQNCYRYEVAGRDDLKNYIIPFFRVNQLKFPSKQNDFEIFCRLMDMIQSGAHHT